MDTNLISNLQSDASASAIFDTSLDERTSRRALELFDAQEAANCRRTDRMFAWLMAVQWIAGVGAALWISPLTWAGRESFIHIHVWGAVFLGGILAALPIFLAWRQPGKAFTRHVIAVAQMLSSALLIHLTGGRIETHFHVFGSLAFLAFYRDWRVLLTATIVVAADHFLRGVFWPMSIFGILTPSHWRWLEHAGWVIFEDIFLLLAIRQNLSASFTICVSRAQLEEVNAEIEARVVERTEELRQENAERRRAEEALIEAHRSVVASSRMAGMAEVATNVLHNVGNVLNSVNVSAGLVAESVRKSKASSLAKVAALLREHEGDLGAFFSSDSRAKQLPAYLDQLSGYLRDNDETTLKEIDSLQMNIEHIKDIVTMQQSYATVSGVKELLDVPALVEDGLRLNVGAFTRHRIEVIREFESVPPVSLDKHKVLQILINLIRNAKYACDESRAADKRVTLRVSNGNGTVKIAVADNGMGITPENLKRIFQHGFTTRKDGHGFGLHSCALAAKEMGGSMSVHSDGPGLGATFVLELPTSGNE